MPRGRLEKEEPSTDQATRLMAALAAAGEGIALSSLGRPWVTKSGEAVGGQGKRGSGAVAGVADRTGGLLILDEECSREEYLAGVGIRDGRRKKCTRTVCAKHPVPHRCTRSGTRSQTELMREATYLFGRVGDDHRGEKQVWQEGREGESAVGRLGGDVFAYAEVGLGRAV